MWYLIHQDLSLLDLFSQDFMDSEHNTFPSEQDQKLQGIFRVELKNPKLSVLPNVKANHKTRLDSTREGIVSTS